MFVNSYGLFVFLLTFLSSTALFCSNLATIGDNDTPCFLEPSTPNPVLLRTSGNSLVLPCHVARSKRSTVEWWYTDAQKTINIKIYPVFPPVRPTVLRFVTSLTSPSTNVNETDILDASILLRYVNVDDSGVYRCVIRPWSMDPLEPIENVPLTMDSDVESLNYQVQLSGPRLCQLNPDVLPCFNAMRTSSPTVIDAYQTAFLQCVVKGYNRPINVFWVVGDLSANNVLVTDFLTTNQYNGDRLRRIFPLSSFDYSIELSVNRTLSERTYSCVVTGATESETTIFTYIVHNINLEEVVPKTLNITHTLIHEQIHSLRESHEKKDEEKNSSEERRHQIEHKEEEEATTEKQEYIEETSTTI